MVRDLHPAHASLQVLLHVLEEEEEHILIVNARVPAEQVCPKPVMSAVDDIHNQKVVGALSVVGATKMTKGWQNLTKNDSKIYFYQKFQRNSSQGFYKSS